MGRYSFDDRRLLGAFREAIVAELTPIVQIKFPYNIQPDLIDTSLTGSGTVTQENSMAKISSGAATSSSAMMLSRESLIYQPGQGAIIRFTALFTEGVAGSLQLAGGGDETDGYFIGYNGADFGILRRQDGVDNWTLGAEMNGNIEKAWIGKTLDHSKGNIYQIQYQWLGFGVITYSIFNPQLGKYLPLHEEHYPNTYTEPSIFNPSLPACVMAENTTNDTDIVVRTGSMALFIEGKLALPQIRHSAENSKTLTTEVAVITIRNDPTYLGKVNRSLILPDIGSLSVDGTKPVTLNIYKNATLGGTPSYTQVEPTHSVVSFDIAGTTVTGGDKLFSLKLSKTGALTTFFSDNKIKLLPGDTMTVSAVSTSSTIADVGISWGELI